MSITNYEDPTLPYSVQTPPPFRKYSIQYWFSQCLYRSVIPVILGRSRGGTNVHNKWNLTAHAKIILLYKYLLNVSHCDTSNIYIYIYIIIYQI